MKRAKLLGAAMAGLILVQSTVSGAQPDDALENQAAAEHVKKAKLAAGPSFQDVADGFLCRSQKDSRDWLAENIPMDETYEPSKAADNLYYVGKRFVGAWILDTGKGLIVWDALNNAEEAKNILVPGLRKLGFKPEDIKHLIVTHGHDDHFGGALYLQQTYKTPIYMSAADWDLVEKNAKSSPRDVEPPKRDRVLEDGQQLTLNGHTVTIVLTPGHTPGTISSILPVAIEGKRHLFTMWGGTAMPKDPLALSRYHDSLHKFWDAGKRVGAEGTISTHPFIADNFNQFAAKAAGGGDPFLIGADRLDNLMHFYDECIVAMQARAPSAD